MEDEIQAGEDGLYCVGFKNVYALNQAQVQDAFSQWGTVHSVRGSLEGDTHRWAFVRFGNPEEAVRAITGMRASPNLCNVNYVKYMTGAPGPRKPRVPGGQAAAAVPAVGSGVSPLVRPDPPASAPGRSPVRAPPAAGGGQRAGQRAGRGGSGKQFEVFVGNWPLSLEEDDLYGLFAKFDIKAQSVRLYKKEDKSFAFVVVSSAEDVSRAIEQLNKGKVAGQQIVVKDSKFSASAKDQSPASEKAEPQQHQQQHQQRQPQQQQQQRQQQPRQPRQQHQQQQQQHQYQQPQHYQQQSAPAAARPTPASGLQSNVRQRLGNAGYRGGAGAVGGGVAAAGPRAQSDVSQMPPLVLPPPEQQQAPPPLAAPYRPRPGPPRAGPGVGAAGPVGGGGGDEGYGQYGTNGAPPAQHNGAGGRPPRPDVHFERDLTQFEPAPLPPRQTRFDRERVPEFEPPRTVQFRGPAGARGPPGGAQSGPPPLAGLGARRSYSQRTDAEADYSEPFTKRGRYGEPEPSGPARLQSGPPPLAGLSGPPPLAGLSGPQARPLSQMPPGQRVIDMTGGPLALRSAVAISERIKSRLHAPMNVVVANFPPGTNEHDLIQLFERFEPLNVRIMVNNSSQHADDFTYAYVTLSSRVMADEAVMEMDGLAFHGRPLVVETTKN